MAPGHARTDAAGSGQGGPTARVPAVSRWRRARGGRRPRRLAAVGVVVAVLLFVPLPFPGWPAHGLNAVARHLLPGSVPPAPSPSAFPTPIRHVFLVLLENAQRSSVLSSGPFEKYLAAKYATADHYYAVCHPSAPNYLALTSGKAWQCGSDGYSNYTSENIGDLAQKAGLSWAGYEESMPHACDTSDSYPYAVKHNPFVYYSDIVGNATVCRAHDVPFTSWTNDVANGTIPAYAMFTPNLTDDGHDTGVGHADTWLKGWLSPLLNTSWFASSVFFLVYDESVNDNTGYNGTAGGRVYFTAVSPYARPAYDLTSNASHYDLLSTAEWLLGLGNCGHNDGTAGFPALTQLFQFPTGGNVSLYPVSGTVSASATGAPVAGATVNLTGRPAATTNGSGGYSFSVPNGTYVLAVHAAGFVPARATVVVEGSPVVLDVALTAVGAVTPYAIAGSVRDATSGEGIAGAAVSVSGSGNTTTDGAGNFSLAEPNGTYAITADAAGYLSAHTNVTVRGADVTVTFRLGRVPSGSLGVSGEVRSAASGDPIPNATVGIAGGPSTLTNGTGGYVLPATNGTWVVHAGAFGYLGANASVTVDGRSMVVNFSLHLSPTGPPLPLALRPNASGAPVTVGERVAFSANPSGGVPPYAVRWSFGDGTTGNGSNITHTFQASGRYEVTVTVRDASGGERQSTMNVSVAAANAGAGGTPFGSDRAGAYLAWVAVGVVAAAVAGVLVVRHVRSRRSRPPDPG